MIRYEQLYGAQDSTKEIPNGFVEETVIRITRNASERITHESRIHDKFADPAMFNVIFRLTRL